MTSIITTLVTNSQLENHLCGYSQKHRNGDNGGMKNKILEFRLARKWSLAKLEELTGISAQQLNRLEKSERAINERNLAILAEAFGCHPSDIIESGKIYQLDNALMKQVIASIEEAAKEAKRNLSIPQFMAYSVILYNHVIKHKNSADSSKPTKALAELILQQKIQ